MEPFQIALAIFAVFVGLTSMNVPRARFWIVTGATSFVATVMYWRLDLPYAPAFAVACDTLVCLTIYFVAREEWEMWLWRIFQLSILVSIAYLVRLIGPHSAYITLLVILNVAALLVIMGTGIVGRIKANGGFSIHSRLRRVRRAYDIIHAKRGSDPFHRNRSNSG